MDILFLGTIIAFTLMCFVTDLRTGRIPNWLTMPMFGLGFVFHVVLGTLSHGAYGGLVGLENSLLGFGAGFGVLFVMMLIGAAGGGDAKMMGALGAWLGGMWTLQVFVASAVVTLIVSSSMMIYTAWTKGYRVAKRRHSGKAVWEANAAAAKGRSPDKGRPGWALPYAVPVTIGTWCVIGFYWYQNGREILDYFLN